MDAARFGGGDVEDDVQRPRVGDLDHRLIRIHRRAEHRVHTCDDAVQRGAQRRQLLRPPRGDRGSLGRRQIGCGLAAVLLREDAGLHEPNRALVRALRIRQRRGGALRDSVERRSLELD